MYPLHLQNPSSNTDTYALRNCAFCQLTNTVLTLLSLTFACPGVHCGLKYQHWPMKRTLVVDQKGCQWRTVPI